MDLAIFRIMNMRIDLIFSQSNKDFFFLIRMVQNPELQKKNHLMEDLLAKKFGSDIFKLKKA